MADIADPTTAARPSTGADFDVGRAALSPLDAIDGTAWLDLAGRAVEPNGYYLPDWAPAASGSDRDRGATFALTARDARHGALTGLLPVTSAWHALRLPLPLLVSADPYHSLDTPLLDRDTADQAAAALLDRASDAGARALLLRYLPLEGPAAQAFRRALQARDLRPRLIRSFARASLDATRDANELLREGLGGRRLKELRRLRKRLAEHGAVHFTVAQTPEAVARGFDLFLSLEASGWKGRSGSALAQHSGDADRLRQAAIALAARGQCEIVTLSAAARPVAAGIVLRHLDRAFFFKLGIDERYARYSPGVQLTLDLTRHLCADPAIALADSTAAPGHPMIDRLWRGRLPIGDMLIPLRRRDPWIGVIEAALRGRNALRATATRLLRRQPSA